MFSRVFLCCIFISSIKSQNLSVEILIEDIPSINSIAMVETSEEIKFKKLKVFEVTDPYVEKFLLGIANINIQEKESKSSLPWVGKTVYLRLNKNKEIIPFIISVNYPYIIGYNIINTKKQNAIYTLHNENFSWILVDLISKELKDNAPKIKSGPIDKEKWKESDRKKIGL